MNRVLAVVLALTLFATTLQPARGLSPFDLRIFEGPLGADEFSEFHTMFSPGEVGAVQLDANDATDPTVPVQFERLDVGCDSGITSIFIDVPLATEALTLSIRQEPDGAPPLTPVLGWKIYARWGQQATFAAHDFVFTNSTADAGWTGPDDLLIVAPRAGRLFFFLTLFEAYDDASYTGVCPHAFDPSNYAFHPDPWNQDRVIFEISADVTSCHVFANTVPISYVPYSSTADLADALFQKFGAADTCSATQHLLTDGLVLSAPAPPLYSSPSDAYIGSVGVPVSYFYFILHGPHAALEVTLGTAGVAFGTTAFLRHNALAVPPANFPPTGPADPRAGNGYVSHAFMSATSLRVPNPQPGYYSLAIVSPASAIATYTAVPYTTTPPYALTDAAAYVGYPLTLDDVPLSTLFANVPIPEHANGLASGILTNIPLQTATNGTHDHVLALATFRVPPSTSLFEISYAAPFHFSVYLSHGAPPYFSAPPSIVSHGAADAFLVAANVNAGSNSTDSIKAGIWWVALVPTTTLSPAQIASDPVSLTITTNEYCPATCNSNGVCLIDGPFGHCNCWTSSGTVVAAYEGPTCRVTRCFTISSCTACIADAACSWCLSTSSCISGGPFSSTALAAHATLCPARPPNYTGDLSSRIVVARDVVANPKTSCPVLVYEGAAFDYGPPPLAPPSNPPSPPPNPPFGTWPSTPLNPVATGPVAATCSPSEVYHYGHVTQGGAESLFNANAQIAAARCEFWRIDPLTSAATDLSFTMGDGNVTGPGCRALAPLVCFPDTRKLVLYGGAMAPRPTIPAAVNSHRSDVWEYDIDAATWTLLAPNCHDPDFVFAAWSSAPHAYPHVDPACDTMVLGPNVYAPGGVGGPRAALGAVTEANPVFRARGIVVTNVIDIDSGAGWFLGRNSWFFNISASPPVWVPITSTGPNPHCAPSLFSGVAFSPVSNAFAFWGGYDLDVAATAPPATNVAYLTATYPCVQTYDRSVADALTVATSYIYHPRFTRTLANDVYALDDGSFVAAGGLMFGTTLYADFRAYSGTSSPSPTPNIGATTRGSVFFFDPLSRTHTTPPLAAKHFPVAATLVPDGNGRVMLFGGTTPNSTSTYSTIRSPPFTTIDTTVRWVYDRTPGGPLPGPGAVLHYVATGAGALVAVAGHDASITIFDAELPYIAAQPADAAARAIAYKYDMGSRTWTAGTPPPFPIPYYGATCVADDKTLYVYGGVVFDATETVSASLFALDTDSLVWTDLTSSMTGDLPGRRAGASCIAHGGILYLSGGAPSRRAAFASGSPPAPLALHMLDLATMVWTTAAAPPAPVLDFVFGPALTYAVTTPGAPPPLDTADHIVVLAVAQAQSASHVLAYSAATDVWTTLATDIPILFNAFASPRTQDGLILYAGGSSFAGARHSVFVYDVLTGFASDVVPTPSVSRAAYAILPPGAPGAGVFGTIASFGGGEAGVGAWQSTPEYPARAVAHLRTLDLMPGAIAYAPSSPTSGLFNEVATVQLTGPFFRLSSDATKITCGAHGRQSTMAGALDAATGVLECTLPRSAVGNATIEVWFGPALRVTTAALFTFEPCPPGTYGELVSTPCIPCPLGYHTPLPGMPSCTICPTALYTPSAGSSVCLACPPGHVLSSLFADRNCIPCPPGRFHNEVASHTSTPVTACEQCSSASYAAGQGNTECTACPRNSQVGITGADSRDKCSCSAGFWGNATVGDGSCVACPPAGADCPFLDNKVPIPRRGFWRDPERPERVLQCALAEACPGGKTSVCASGYTGEACSECADQHYPLNGKCEACPKNSVLPLIIAGVIMLLFIILLYKFAGKSGSGSRSAFGSASIALNFIQMTALFTAYKMNWPDEMVAIMKWFSIMNLNLDVASPECALPISYKTKWLITMSIPVVVAVLYVGHMVVRYAWSWVLGATCCAARAGAGASTSAPSAAGRTYDASEQEEEGDGVEMVAVGESEASSDASSSGGGDETAVVAASTCSMCVVMSGSDRGSMANQTLHAYLLFLSLAYVFVSSKSLEVFSCAPQTDGSYYLNAHPSIKCYEGSWWDLVPYAIVAGLVYGAGIPGVFTAILFRVFKRAVNDPDEASYELYMARYGFLTSRYLLRWFAWELTIMGRKMAIIACTLFFQELVIMQNLMAMLVVFASVLLQVYSRPYRNPKDNKLEFILLCTDYFILFLGILFSSDLDDTSATVLTVLGVTVLILSILSIVGYLALEVRRVYYTRRYKAVARENPDLVKRAEFVLTEDAYFSLMEVLKAVEKEDATSYTAVLSELADATRAIRRQEPVAVFVEEVQRTFHVYRQTASEADLALLDAIVLHITQESIATKDGDGGLAFARLARNGALPAASDSSSSLSSASGSTDDGVEPLSTRAPAFPAPSVHTSILPPTPDKDDDDGTGAGVGTRRGARAGRTLASSRQRSPRRSPSPRSSVSPRRSPVEQTPRTTSDNSSPVPPTHGRSGRAPTAAPLLAASASATAAAIAADLADSDSSSELGALNPADFAFRRSATASTLNASVPTTRISRKRV